MARPTCMYCGAALSEEILRAAEESSRRVLETRNIAALENAATGARSQNRRYIVIDLNDIPPERIARACDVSAWDARQWRASSRYRLFRVTAEAPGGPTENGLTDNDVPFFSIGEDAVARSRTPMTVDTLVVGGDAVSCSFRENENQPPSRVVLGADTLLLMVSGVISRKRVRDEGAKRGSLADTRLEDAWLVHFHLRSQERPLEIDPFHTTFQGMGLASAHMRTLETIRSLAAVVMLDEAFKNIVPALSPTAARDDDSPLKQASSGARKDAKAVVLDNTSQFREYSAWRGRVEALKGRSPSPAA